MKRVVEYRKLLEVDKNVTLKELKTIYRNSMKDSHPDKFVNDEAGKLAAEERSKEIIGAYHFLVSISNETLEKNLPEYRLIPNLKRPHACSHHHRDNRIENQKNFD